MARKLEYDIVTDPSKGIAGLKQFAGAAKKSMREIDDSLDDTTTSAQKLAKVLGGLADDLEGELEQAARAADALGQALGPELAARSDVGSLVSDLQRMGLTFDEITADADVLAASLKRMDDVTLSGLNRGLGGVETSMGRVRGNADQTGSVMANMAGNSAQDLGELVGVTGTLGVTLGQLSEYATEGGIGLAQFAKLAGPMAALGLATAITAKYFKTIADTKAFEEDRVRDFADALADAKVSAQELQDILAGKEDPNSLMARIGSETRDVEDNVERVMGTFEAFNAVVAGGTPEFHRWAVEQLRIAKAAGASEDELANLNEAMLTGLHTTQANSKVAFALGQGYDDVVYSAYALGAAIRQQGEATAETGRDLAFYGDSLEDTDDTGTKTSDTLKALADNFNLVGGAIREQEKLTAEYNIALADAQGSLDGLVDGFSILGRKQGAIRDAFALGNAPLDVLGAVQDVNEAIRDLGEFIRDEGVPNIFDPNDVDAQPFLAKIEGLRAPIQEAVANAFATGGPAAATATADAYVAQIVASMRGKLTEGEVRTLLGLDDLEATLRIAVDQSDLALARESLAVLVGLKGETPWTASIALALQAGDITPQAAEALINEQLAGAGVKIPAALGPVANTAAVMRETQNEINRRRPLDIPAQLRFSRQLGMQLDAGGTAPPGGGIAGERGPEILNGRYLTAGTTYVPPGTKVTSRRQTARVLRTRGARGLRRYDAGGVVPAGPVTNNIHIQAAVIGNRYEVMRAVRRANRDANRLTGTRG